MIKSAVLQKEYTDREQLIKDVLASKADLLAIKKASFKCSDGFVNGVVSDNSVTKSDSVLKIGDVVHNVINTTNYLDSHDDVHLDNIWNKSAKDQNGKTYHVADHSLQVGMIVGYPKDVNIRIEQMAWKELGYNYSGYTQCLIFDTKITEKTNRDIFLAYRDNEPIQHSIRMEYVDIQLAVDDKSDADGYKLYNEVLNLIANREKAEAQGYFFVVKEAKISKEGSTVLFGSNDITPYRGFTQSVEPSFDTHKVEPIDFVSMCKNIKFL